MNNKFLSSILLSALLGIVSGCTSTSYLGNIDSTPINYPDKLPLKLEVHMDEGLLERLITTKPLTRGCALWKAELDAGDGYWDAISMGLKNSFDHVVFVSDKRDPKKLISDEYLYVEAKLKYDSASVFVIDSLFSQSINTLYMSSLELKFYTKKGDLLYTFNATGSAANKQPATECDDMASVLKECVRLTLVQISNYISQAAYVAPEFRDYVKKLKK